jgi:peroxiredoxin
LIQNIETKKFNYRAVILVILAVAGLLALFALNQKGSFRKSFELKSSDVGLPAPNFEFPGLNGKTVSLSDYRGKVVFVNIWATWCRPCVDEMPSMQKLYQEFKDDDFEILAVSIDVLGATVVAPFMQKYSLTFPALLDSEGTIRESYGATGIPESFIIDRQGILVKKIIGAADWSSPEVFGFFRNLLQKPLSEK